MFFSSVRDVLFQNFESYKPEVQELICVADHLGSMMQYETPGFLPNKRIHRGILKMLCKFEVGVAGRVSVVIIECCIFSICKLILCSASFKSDRKFKIIIIQHFLDLAGHWKSGSPRLFDVVHYFPVNTLLSCFSFPDFKTEYLALIDLLFLLLVPLFCLTSAMGLATLEVMQAVQRTWANSKVRMNGKTRLMQWRDMFDIAVKWRR